MMERINILMMYTMLQVMLSSLCTSAQSDTASSPEKPIGEGEEKVQQMYWITVVPASVQYKLNDRRKMKDVHYPENENTKGTAIIKRREESDKQATPK